MFTWKWAGLANRAGLTSRDSFHLAFIWDFSSHPSGPRSLFKSRDLSKVGAKFTICNIFVHEHAITIMTLIYNWNFIDCCYVYHQSKKEVLNNFNLLLLSWRKTIHRLRWVKKRNVKEKKKVAAGLTQNI